MLVIDFSLSWYKNSETLLAVSIRSCSDIDVSEHSPATLQAELDNSEMLTEYLTSWLIHFIISLGNVKKLSLHYLRLVFTWVIGSQRNYCVFNILCHSVMYDSLTLCLTQQNHSNSSKRSLPGVRIVQCHQILLITLVSSNLFIPPFIAFIVA